MTNENNNMLESVVWKNPGLIDKTSFTTFGINAKPNSKNPIGFFGTGLKYAIAVFLRTGHQIKLYIDGIEYEFYTKNKDFRNKSFETVYLKKRANIKSRWTATQLPFTIELGKNWDVWQAFRELESNVRDEGGFSYSTTCTEFTKEELQGHTVFVVTGDVIDAYENIDDIFLSDRIDEEYASIENNQITCYNKSTNYLFYRGLRVFESEKPFMYTYNIHSDLKLTEDRTIDDKYVVLSMIRNLITNCKNKDFIEPLIKERDLDKQVFEDQISYDYEYGADAIFKEMVKEKVQDRRYKVRPTFQTFSTRYLEPQKPSDDIDLTLSREEIYYLGEHPSIDKSCIPNIMQAYDEAKEEDEDYNSAPQF